MKTPRDISTLSDIRLLVDTFYAKIREDELLKDIFGNVIGDAWPEHLDKMYRFWETVLLEKHTYQGSPFLPHADLPVKQEHFDRWLFLFSSVINELFAGPKADEALWRARKMAEMFLLKIEYGRNSRHLL